MSRLINPWVQHDGPSAPYANGTVYFGEPNQDPVSNPKAPYSDSALTVPIGASQELDDKGMYSTAIYLKGSYSMSLFDSLGNPVRTEPEITGVITQSDELTITKSTIAAAKSDDDLVNFVGGFIAVIEYTAGNVINAVYKIIAGAGAEDNVFIHNSDTASLFHLVLQHNGVITMATAGGQNGATVDASAALLTTLAAGVELDGEGNTYLISNVVTHVDDSRIKNIKFKIDDSISGSGIVLGPSSAENTSALASGTYTLGDNTIAVTNTTGMAVGQIIHLKSTRIWQYDAPRNLFAGECNRIKGIAGNVITLEITLSDTYETLGNTITVNTYAETAVRLTDVEVFRDSPIEKGGLTVRRCVFPIIENQTIRNCGSAGLNLSGCYMAEIASPTLIDNHVSGGSTGYGIQDNSSVFTLVTNLKGSNNRRAIDFSGTFPSRFGIVNGFAVTGFAGTGSCVGTHGTAQGIIFANGTCDGSIIGVQIRGPNCVVHNVKFKDNTTRAITLNYTLACTITSCDQNPIFTGNVSGSPISAIPARFLEISNLPSTLSSAEKLYVQNNTATVRTDFIRIAGAATDGIKQCVITNNNVDVRTNTSGNDLYFISSGAATTLASCRITGNTMNVNGHTGTFGYYDANITISDAAANQIQNVDLVAADLVKSSGAGTLVVDNVDVRYDSDGEYAHVFGEVEFTISVDTVDVKLINMPQKQDGSALGNQMGGRFDGAWSEVLVTKNNRLDIFLGYSGFRVSGDVLEPFPIGVHVVPIDLKYKMRFPLE